MAQATDIYETLAKEHSQVKTLLDKITEGDGEDTSTVFAELQMKLEAHTRAEEKVFYEPLLRPSSTHEIVLEGYEEHHVVDILLDELARQDTTDERWHAKAKVLKDNVKHHIEEEEGQMFTRARQEMDTEWAAEVAQKFEDEKNKRKLS